MSLVILVLKKPRQNTHTDVARPRVLWLPHVASLPSPCRSALLGSPPAAVPPMGTTSRTSFGVPACHTHYLVRPYAYPSEELICGTPLLELPPPLPWQSTQDLAQSRWCSRDIVECSAAFIMLEHPSS